MKYSIDIRVYYEDTDAGGIVYHANYLNFAERGRTEFLRHIGFQCSDVHNEVGVMFVVRHIDIDYLKPAQLDDLLQLETSILELKNTSFVMHQRAVKSGEPLADMRVTLVCVDTQTFRPVKLPAAIKRAFQDYREDKSV